MFARILLVGLLLGLPVVQALAYDEGIEYATVPAPQPTETDGKVEVLELFWYGCPHCWHLEPIVQKWQTTMPANVSFRRMPAILGPTWEPLARAYFAASPCRAFTLSGETASTASKSWRASAARPSLRRAQPSPVL